MPPIVLHHGLLSFGTIRVGRLKISTFQGVRKAFIQRGHPLMIENVHPTASIDFRARALKRMILDRFGDSSERIIIFAHSMGGLDSRYMITHLGMADRVAALVTVCTPHRGSPYADWVMKNLGRKLEASKLARRMKLDITAGNDLTTEACRAFNEATPDMPQVKYYSVSAARPRFRLAPIYYQSQPIIFDAEGDNDGLVSVKSAQWGEHLGTWPVDHMHAINHRFVIEGLDRHSSVTPRYLEVLDRVMADQSKEPRT